MAIKLGGLIAAAAALGAAAAGVSYMMKYKSFHDDLEEDFEEFDGAEDDFEESETDDVRFSADEEPEYSDLDANREEFIAAAKDTLNAVKNLTSAGLAILKDMGKIAADNAGQAGNVAKDTYRGVRESAGERFGEFKETAGEKYATFMETAGEKATDLKGRAETLFEDTKTIIKDKIDEFRGGSRRKSSKRTPTR